MSTKNSTKKYTFPSIPSDGTHRGAYDFYAPVKQEILRAISSGLPFDTGWMGCKHTILSSRIARDSRGTLTCRVAISDDFDTQGTGSVEVPAKGGAPDEQLSLIQKALEKAHDEAEQDQNENKTVAMFAVGKAGQDGKRTSWEETYLLDVDPNGFPSDTPPGDYYHSWGWQDETDAIPAAVKEKMEKAIVEGSLPFTMGGWIVEEVN